MFEMLTDGYEGEGCSFTSSEPLDLEGLRLLLKDLDQLQEPEADAGPLLPVPS